MRPSTGVQKVLREAQSWSLGLCCGRVDDIAVKGRWLELFAHGTTTEDLRSDAVSRKARSPRAYPRREPRKFPTPETQTELDMEIVVEVSLDFPGENAEQASMRDRDRSRLSWCPV